MSNPALRTKEEAIAWCDGRNSPFGFEQEVIVEFLTFEEARRWLKPEATSDGWPEPAALTSESVTEKMRGYMDFAWSKVAGHRGLSASRSIQKMSAWLYLLGDDDLLNLCNDPRQYPQYGAPILKAICEKYGFPMPNSDSIARMAHGQPCEPGCQQGC